MCPEYGATIAIFPIDEMTLDYLRLTGRDEARVELVEAYAQGAGAVPHRRRCPTRSTPRSIELDLGDGRAEPGRPAAAAGSRVAEAGEERLPDGAAGADVPRSRKAKPTARSPAAATSRGAAPRSPSAVRRSDSSSTASVVIAAITSCTNTSNPSVMIAAGLVAKKAVERGLTRQPWVKTSLAPGSKVVTEYLQRGRSRHLSRSRSASTSSATAAPPASATAVRCPTRSRAEIESKQPGRRLGAERQPQLRRAHPAARARQLPGVAAAGRRLRPGRLDDHRPDHRAARHRHRRASRSTCATSGRPSAKFRRRCCGR